MIKTVKMTPTGTIYIYILQKCQYELRCQHGQNCKNYKKYMIKTINMSITIKMRKFVNMSNTVNMKRLVWVKHVVNCMLLFQPSSAMRQARKWGDGPRRGEKVNQRPDVQILGILGKSNKYNSIFVRVLSGKIINHAVQSIILL